MCVRTSQNAGARRTAHRCCDERIHKVGSFLAKNFVSFRHYVRWSKFIVQIICQNKNYVGSPCRSWTASRIVLWFACGRRKITQQEQYENCRAFRHFPPNQSINLDGGEVVAQLIVVSGIPGSQQWKSKEKIMKTHQPTSLIDPF